MAKREKLPCAERERKSSFIRLLHTTPAKTVCPNFYLLAHANGCTFSPRCSYCYLKSSFGHLKGEEVFTNVDTMLDEVKRWIHRDGLDTYILNMGNLSDSLAFEDVRPVVPQLVELFRTGAEANGRPHTLLLVSKGGTKDCEGLFKTEPCQNVIVSFSVNSPEAARRHERGPATIADRMRAAERLSKNGWRIRIRLDPMMRGFDYTEIIERLRRLSPERVTLGSLRAEKNLYRHSDDGLFDELQKPPGHDKVFSLARYPKKERLAMYQQAVDVLRDVCPIGLCEETTDIWDALGLDTEAKTCNCGD